MWLSIFLVRQFVTPSLLLLTIACGVTVGGQPLDAARIYTVATNDFIYAGGDGYGALNRGKSVIDASGATLMATMVMDYIAKMGAVSPKLEGRIKTP